MAEDGIKYDVVAVGGSAGSLEVIMKIVAALPYPNKVSCIIVLHRKNDSSSLFEELLKSRTRLPVKEVEDKDPVLPGHVYIAPADYHMLIENDKSFSLDVSEKIHFSRPSIDVTFESIAEIYGKHCIGILLSGANADGAEGMLALHQQGAYTIVQDPASAEVPYMPQQAINLHAYTKICNVQELPSLLQQLLYAQ